MSHGRASDLIPLDMVGHLPHRKQSTVARKEIEDDDPYEPVFVTLPSPEGYDAMGEMARCMVEEYAMMGFSSETMMKMFKNPYYQALHHVHEARGEAYVTDLLASVYSPAEAPNTVGSNLSQTPGGSMSETCNPGVPNA